MIAEKGRTVDSSRGKSGIAAMVQRGYVRAPFAASSRPLGWPGEQGLAGSQAALAQGAGAPRSKQALLYGSSSVSQ